MLTKNSTSPSTVNAIAGFADRTVSTSLKPDARKLYKRNILARLIRQRAPERPASVV
jgi:2-methylcitrate dehydratase